MSMATLLGIVVGLIIDGVLALIAGNIASKKGYSYEGFVLLGLFLPVIGFVIALVMPDKEPSSMGTADELAKFKELLDNGAISQSEYDTKKQELLSRHSS